MSIDLIKSLRQELAQAAQEIYDQWDQSGPDGDIELGFGGICQDIASAMANVLSQNGIHCSTVFSSVGDNHVWVVAVVDDGVYEVDIPYHVYEFGSGYTWNKKENIVFTEEDVCIARLSHDPKDYIQYSDDDTYEPPASPRL